MAVHHEGHRWLAMAGIWRPSDKVGEAFMLLSADAGPEIASSRYGQIIPLTRDQWADGLDLTVLAGDVRRILPEGTLIPKRVYGTPPGSAQLALL